MIYFENAASTRPLPEVVSLFGEMALTYYANPASQNPLAIEGEEVLKKARTTLASLIHAQSPEEIFFTSGGTESNNWAIFGTAAAYAKRGRHVLTTPVEHPAVLMPYEQLRKQGFTVEILPVDEAGRVQPEDLLAALRPDTILVSTILVNNETGAVQDVETLGKIIREHSDAVYHVDAVQAFGKMPIHVGHTHIDLLSASGHKFHAPKGLGFLYRRKGLLTRPILFGGGHQWGQRPGTENPAGAAALALAAKRSYEDLEHHTSQVRRVKERLWQEVSSRLEDVFLNGPSLEESSPYVLNLRFSGLRGPVLLNALEEKGIYASAGSACNTKKKVQSSVLSALGLSEEEITGSLRFSFCRENTEQEAVQCAMALAEIVPVLRHFHRKR